MHVRRPSASAGGSARRPRWWPRPRRPAGPGRDQRPGDHRARRPRRRLRPARPSDAAGRSRTRQLAPACRCRTSRAPAARSASRSSCTKGVAQPEPARHRPRHGRGDHDQQVAGHARPGDAARPAHRRVPAAGRGGRLRRSRRSTTCWPEFKADPGSVSWGGFALGSPDHILCALIVKASGGDVAKMNYIVAGAGGEMLAQVMGGHITVATGGLNEMAQQIEAGKLRALGISSPERLPGVDIPTFKEQGVDVELVNWRGLMAPGQDAAGRQEGARRGPGRDGPSDEWQALLKERGWVDMYQPAEEFAAFLGPERAPDRGHPQGCRPGAVVDGPAQRHGAPTMTTEEPAEVGREPMLGGGVWRSGLFIAFETAQIEVAPSQRRGRPAPVPVPGRDRPVVVGAGAAARGVLRPHRARGRLRARLARGGAGRRPG